jgi:hypothetical protein
MKRVLEDDLIALAFGEYDGDDAGSLRAAIDADPVLASEYAKYAAMSHELGNLRHVPPMQLSTEAIVARAESSPAESKHFFSRLAWLWMPATAFATAAIAYAVFTALRPTPTPQLVGFDADTSFGGAPSVTVKAPTAGKQASVSPNSPPVVGDVTPSVLTQRAEPERKVALRPNRPELAPDGTVRRRKVRRSVRGRAYNVASLTTGAPRDAASSMVTTMAQPVDEGQITAAVPRQEIMPPVVAMAAPPIDLPAPSTVLVREDPTVVRTDASPVVTVPTLNGVEVRG